MFSLGRLLSIAAMAAIVIHAPDHVRADQLQPEFDVPLVEGSQKIAAYSDKKTHKAAVFLDDELPDAPDLDDIPFLTMRRTEAYLRADAGFGVPFSHHALTANGAFNPTLSGPALFGVGIGYAIGQMLRAEVAAEYRARGGVQTADRIRAHTIGGQMLANVYADIGTWYGITPYIGAGAGIGWEKLSLATFPHQNQSGFVWAVSGGFAAEISPKITFDIGYRYLDMGTHRTPALVLRESGSHDVRVGLRWRFGERADLP